MAHLLRTVINAVILNLLVVVSSDPALAKSAEEFDAETNQALDTLYAESSAAKELGAGPLVGETKFDTDADTAFASGNV